MQTKIVKGDRLKKGIRNWRKEIETREEQASSDVKNTEERWEEGDKALDRDLRG